jgi:hypothetical protein
MQVSVNLRSKVTTDNPTTDNRQPTTTYPKTGSQPKPRGVNCFRSAEEGVTTRQPTTFFEP